MTLDEMLDAAATGSEIIVAGGWGQGRATYGGLVAALMVARAEALCADPARHLRAASTTFVVPVSPGPASLVGEVLRAGSSATTIDIRLIQDGTTRASLVASFGAHRDTRVSAAPDAPRPELADAADCTPLPYLAGVTPDFFQHVDLRIGSGEFPFSGARHGAFGGWMAFAQPPARFGDRELVALIDAWPPAISPRCAGPAPMSTLSWSLSLTGDTQERAEAIDPAARWQYDVHTVTASGGYAQSAARVWDPAGRLRAVSQQTIAYFDPAGT